MKTMDSEGKIGVFEGICLTAVVLNNKIFFTSVGYIVYQTGTAAWFTTLISGGFTLLFFMFYSLLLKRFPGKDMVAIFEGVLGKIVGKAILLFMCAYVLFNSGTTLREFAEMIKVYNLPRTPISIIMVAFLTVSVILSYYGLPSLSRVCALCAIPILTGMLLILLMASPSYNIKLLNPIGGYGLSTTLKYGFLRSSAYFEFVMLSFAVNAVGGYKKYKKIGLISIIIASIIFSTVLICYLMTFGFAAGSENISGFFELSRSIYFNRFIQRVESVFLFTWVISSVISSTVSFYFALLVYCKIFTVKDHKPLLIPLAILMFIVAILPASLQALTQTSLAFLREYSMFVIYLPVIIVLLVSILFKKKGCGINS